MVNFKGSKTEQNLVNSFIDESQSYTRYMFYAGAATKEGYYPVAEIFRETANNEMHHAKVFLKFLENTEVACTANVDAGFLGKTTDNLECAIREEQVAGYEFYEAAAQTAIEEGFPEIASHFKAIATVEKVHHDRFQHFLNLINTNTLWKREKPVTWKCLVCGYSEVGTEPPVKCPGCDHPYQHYIALEDGYAPAAVD